MPSDGPYRVRDLLDADEDSVRWAAREIEHDDLVAVLSVEAEEVVDRLCDAMGQRRAMMLRDDIGFAVELAPAVIADAERRVDAVLRRLVRDGRVSLLVPEDEDDEPVLSDEEIDDLLEGIADEPL